MNVTDDGRTNSNGAAPDAEAGSGGRLAEALAEYRALLEAGSPPDRAAFLSRYPEMAEELAECVSGLEFVHAIAPALSGASAEGGAAAAAGAGMEPGAPLGDFRLIREIGRGGMGVVYEAEQLSLRRRVALKLLPLAGMMDPRHLQRFHHEAQAAACLHHTNIVPVFFVGSERGVHFYAMQLIDGLTLAAAIHGLRPKPATTASEPGKEPAQGTTAPVGYLSTSKPGGDAAYFRKVAAIGAQAAEALDHAHQQGIVHRDVKPANLLVDADGRVWITDFGLAQIQSDARLTLTGDLVGTLRYMSPEQALAKRAIVDHRTDVYSLGATLYELLTLRPVFAGEDRQEMLRQIAFEEAPPPRRINKAIPTELETVVLKALEKNPAERYATAQELADDLRRWLDDRPIQARRPSLAQVAGKWAKRHKAVVWSAALVVLVLLVFAVGNAMWWVRRQTEAETEARAALQEGNRWLQEEKWSEGLSAVGAPRGALRGFWADAALKREVDQLGKDLEMAQHLEEAALRMMTAKDGRLDFEAAIAAYTAAFEWYGLDVEHGDVAKVAESIQSSPIRMQLVAALDHWAGLRWMQNQESTRLLAVARAADSNAWRNGLRDACERRDNKAIDDLLASADGTTPPVGTLRLLIETPVIVIQHYERVVYLLRRAQRQYPADFWTNFELAGVLQQLHPSNLEEPIRHNMIAVALRPHNSLAHVNLGVSLKNNGQLDEAIDEFRAAIRIKNDNADAHTNLGNAHLVQARLDEAIDEYREAIRIEKDHVKAHANLGMALLAKGMLDEAIAESREAIRIKKDFAEAHTNLGDALQAKGRLDEAVKEYHEAIRLKKDYLLAHNKLGNALQRKGKLDEAIDEYREAIRIKEDYAEAHSNLGAALRDKGLLDEAIDEYREAIRIKKDYAEAHYNLGFALLAKGRLDEAIDEYREAIRIKKDYADAHNNLGDALRVKGRVDEAIDEFREAIRINKDDDLAHVNLGYLLADKGRQDEAIDEFREAIRINKDYAVAHYNLGHALKAKGMLDQAIEEYREAIRVKKDYAEAHNNLGNALAAKGRLDEAIDEYRKAIQYRPKFAEALGSLGLALLRKGRFAEAKAFTEQALELLPDKNPLRALISPQLQQCNQMLALEAKLPEVLAGKARPTDNRERLGLIVVCQFQKRHAAATKLYVDAFTADAKLAEDLKGARRYNAACHAALAGGGQGEDAADLDAKERARLRQQSLDWLRADLTVWGKQLEMTPDKAVPDVVQKMQHWLEDADFNGVRGAEALAKLPEAERGDWQRLWEEVAALRQQAQPKEK